MRRPTWCVISFQKEWNAYLCVRPNSWVWITPLSVSEERGVKGLYAKARSGQLKNFTGIDSPYEAPETPEIHIDTTAMSIDDAAEQIVKLLKEREYV